jgi:oligoribonuclease NrnB/cAMP/cGMP phosphodiesterase (DHH superfamily)
MIVYHLSHTDLDGYSCQLLMDKYFEKIHLFNANYGTEVRVNIENIVNELRDEDKEKRIYFFITDLNLTDDESKWLNREYKSLLEDGYNLKIQLLDHHKTGEASSKKYDWYYLDISRSATKITYDYLAEHFKPIKSMDKIATYVKAVNAVDLWIEDDELFEFGKVCMGLIYEANSINKLLFEHDNREFKYFLLQKAINFLGDENSHIELDDKIHFIKKEFLQNIDNQIQPNDTMDNLKAKFVTNLLENNKDKFTINFKNHKGLFTYTLSSISIPANTFLKQNDDYDFFMDLGKRGSISLRADGKFDVSEFAQLLADGGGHRNASGGKFNNFKEVYRYEDAKEFIQKEFDKHQ